MAMSIFLRSDGESWASRARDSQPGAAPTPNIARAEFFRNNLRVVMFLHLFGKPHASGARLPSPLLKFRRAERQARNQRQRLFGPRLRHRLQGLLNGGLCLRAGLL